MKKILFAFPASLLILSIAFISCHKKTDSASGPGYKQINGTGGNPFPHPTGVTTSTNPATQNSNLFVGGVGWSNPACASTQSLSLKGINGNVEVTLTFSTAPTTGTYVVAPSPSGIACSMVVNNAPNQPGGILWYGASGIVTVNTSAANSINASFAGVICYEQGYTFPQVTVTGNLGCN